LARQSAGIGFVVFSDPLPSYYVRLTTVERRRKLARGLREELTEEERYRVANDVVHRLKQHGDPWRLSEELPPPGKGHSTQ
jgi:hypothetical protein